eukprot:g64976.t1
MSVYSELGWQLRVCRPCLLLPALCEARLCLSAPDVNLMRKVKLGLASAGALSASFLKVFGDGNSQDCNQCNTQHTAPPPLESGSGSPSNAHPFQSSTSFSRVFGSDHETTSSPSFSRVFGFDRTSSPSPSIPTSVFKTEPPVSSLHSTLGFFVQNSLYSYPKR